MCQDAKHFAVRVKLNRLLARILQASLNFFFFFKLIIDSAHVGITRLVASKDIDIKPGRRVFAIARCETLAKSREPFGLIERYYIAACRAKMTRGTRNRCKSSLRRAS